MQELDKSNDMVLFTGVQHLCVDQVAQEARCFPTDWIGPGSIPGVGSVEIILHSFVSRRVHSPSYKMSIVDFPRGYRRLSRRKRRHLVVQKPIIFHNNARSQTAAAVTNLMRRWQWEILQHSPIMISSTEWKNHCEGPGTIQEMDLFVQEVINKWGDYTEGTVFSAV